MTARLDEYDRGSALEESEHECRAEAVEESAGDGTNGVAPTSQSRLPWIGTLPNPRLGPIVVINDNGYLVPLWTAGELLRGCKYFWRASRD
jgi:hypothetical protein